MRNAMRLSVLLCSGGSIALLATSACSTITGGDAARTRYALSHHCTEDRVTITPLGNSEYEADGCTGTQRYRCTERHEGAGFTCVLLEEEGIAERPAHPEAETGSVTSTTPGSTPGGASGPTGSGTASGPADSAGTTSGGEAPRADTLLVEIVDATNANVDGHAVASDELLARLAREARTRGVSRAIVVPQTTAPYARVVAVQNLLQREGLTTEVRASSTTAPATRP